MPVFETKVTPSVNTGTGEITMLVETLGQRISRDVMYTKEEATRAALIALGWTPPDERVEPCKKRENSHSCNRVVLRYPNSGARKLFRDSPDN